MNTPKDTPRDTPKDTPKDYARCSYWLETAGDLTPRAALGGSLEADVVVLGAGFTGLWTAYYLLKRQPGLRVVVLEREIAGFGASGRNGGWCSSAFTLSLAELWRRYGADAAVRVNAAMRETVDEVGRVAAHEGLDIDYHKGGALLLARGPHELETLQSSLETYRRLGLSEHYHPVAAAETTARVNAEGALGAIFNPHCASLHPAKLARGLARTVARLGGRLFEQTPVVRVSGGASPSLYTPRGVVRAKTVVLAGEAYLAKFPGVARQLIPLYSLVVLTRPLSEAQWRDIGWQRRECVTGLSLVVDYLTRTADGRILFGGRGAPYYYGSGIAERFERDRVTHQRLREAAMRWFPTLRPADFTHAWGGPFAVSRDWTPTITLDPATRVASARGYGGLGVATSNLAGRTLADLIMGEVSALTTLPIIGHRSPNWVPEPLRYLGVRYVQRAYFQLDAKAERTGLAPSGESLAERMARH